MNTNLYSSGMKTISIEKGKDTSVTEVLAKWWNAKNVFFSKLAEEDFSNREVILAHCILISFLIGVLAAETSILISFLALLVAGGFVVCLNKTDGNENINIKKNIL